jgi:cytochrome P450
MAILGVAAEDEPILMELTQKFFNPQDPEINQSLDEAASAEISEPTSTDAIAGFANYFNDLTAQRRRDPTNDVASVIANSKLDGELISEWDAVSYYVTIATAGHDTTSSSISGAIWALCEDPDQFLAIRKDRSLIPGLVDESIRWTSPVRHFMRTAAVDVELGGQSIRKGDWLMLVYPSGNRDEDVFDRPFTFDARRSPNPHLGFGYGAHLCLGLHLAKMEIRIFFEEFFSRISSISFAGTPQLTRSVFVGGPKTLPVSFVVD